VTGTSKDISFIHSLHSLHGQQALFDATAGPRDVCLQFTMMPPGPSATPVTRPVRFHVQLHVELNDAKTAAAAAAACSPLRNRLPTAPKVTRQSARRPPRSASLPCAAGAVPRWTRLEPKAIAAVSSSFKIQEHLSACRRRC